MSKKPARFFYWANRHYTNKQWRKPQKRWRTFFQNDTRRLFTGFADNGSGSGTNKLNTPHCNMHRLHIISPSYPLLGLVVSFFITFSSAPQWPISMCPPSRSHSPSLNNCCFGDCYRNASLVSRCTIGRTSKCNAIDEIRRSLCGFC